jgi:hypothetical protein
MTKDNTSACSSKTASLLSFARVPLISLLEMRGTRRTNATMHAQELAGTWQETRPEPSCVVQSPNPLTVAAEAC